MSASVINNIQGNEIKQWVPEFDNYLVHTAQTAKVTCTWELLRELLRYRIKQLCEMKSDDNNQIINDESIEDFQMRIWAILDSFDKPPFTIQRLCELVTISQEQHKNIWKYLRAIEKVLLVTSCLSSSNTVTMQEEEEEVTLKLSDFNDNASESLTDIDTKFPTTTSNNISNIKNDNTTNNINNNKLSNDNINENTKNNTNPVPTPNEINNINEKQEDKVLPSNNDMNTMSVDTETIKNNEENVVDMDINSDSDKMNVQPVAEQDSMQNDNAMDISQDGI